MNSVEELRPGWRPAHECPQDGRPVYGLFPGNPDDDDPAVVRRLGPTLWVGICGSLGDVPVNPERWRSIPWVEWRHLVDLFPGAMPSELAGLVIPASLKQRDKS